MDASEARAWQQRLGQAYATLIQAQVTLDREMRENVLCFERAMDFEAYLHGRAPEGDEVAAQAIITMEWSDSLTRYADAMRTERDAYRAWWAILKEGEVVTDVPAPTT